MTAGNQIAIAEAVGNFEDANYGTQLNCEVFLINMIGGFIEKEQGWTEILEKDSLNAYVATLESGEDPSKSAKAAQWNEQYNIDSAMMQSEESSYNAIVQKGKTAVTNANSSMGTNYEKELPVQTQSTTMDHLIEGWLRR
ncbi:MAG TPA: hypothetical protein VJK48_04995 [Chlamydiales bacterium]|nr:hypothetical protein [Chlamydiales bacterium]